MIIYLLLTAVTIGISLSVDNKCEKLPYGYSKQQAINAVSVFVITTLLFVVSALRLNVGNDYAKYVEYFHLIRCRLDTYTVVPTEPGFNLVCLIIYFISGKQENYLLMFAVFAFVTVFLFVKGLFKQSDSFWFSFTLFMLMGYYFRSFNTVRYYFALALAFTAIPLVLEKKWLKFILVIVAGCFFHKSLILVIPLYFLAQLTWKVWQMVAGALFCASFFIFRPWYVKLFLWIYPTYEDTEYLGGGLSLVSMGICLSVLILSLMLYKRVIKDNRCMKFYFYCNVMALLIYICCSFLPSVSRVAYYLSITHILFIPALIRGIESKYLRRSLRIAVIVAFVAYFAIFLLKEAPANGLRILPYETWLYHDMVPILSDVT